MKGLVVRVATITISAGMSVIAPPPRYHDYPFRIFISCFMPYTQTCPNLPAISKAWNSTDQFIVDWQFQQC